MGNELTGDTSAAAGAIPNPLPISAAALPLPAGAATAAGQVLANPLPVSAAALPLPAGAATAAGQVLANPLPVAELPATLVAIATGGANAIATATLPAAGVGLFHYITHISIRRVATALLAGGAILAVTSTNLGGRTWRTGNQASITVDTMDGGLLVEADYAHPIKSAAANTPTTIVGPAAGAAVSWQIQVDYFTAA